ncbi:MAG: threonylcarbamoyl-AMP synthase [Deltaproteobacteria bacterium]|nr:threonylcarbamoyl-AMP synthase [Deltaproteobacteria bacterium]
MPEIIKIDPLYPEPSQIEKAMEILKSGGVISYPTETFYGLGADAANEKAIEKIYAIKGREDKKPISIIIGSAQDIDIFAVNISEGSRKLMERFWPGGLTLVFEASPTIPEILTAETGKIGIRYSSHAIAAHLARNLPGGLSATSANISGEKECTSADEVIETLSDRIDALIDGGTTPGGSSSTVVDVSMEPPVILREGIISSSLIDEIIGQ